MSVAKDRKNRKAWRIVRSLLLTTASLMMLAWIFSNSLQVGSQSAEQSSRVTIWVQKVFRVFAPNSFIANATGKDFAKLHSVIRSLAHFAEFGLLGALFGWTCLSYTGKIGYFLFTALLIVLVPIADELLQMYTPGRGAELKDVLIDTAGGLSGMLFAWLIVWIGKSIARKKKRKKEKE